MKPTVLFLLLLCSTYLFAQDSASTSCGQKKATENLFNRNPQLRSLHEQIEARLYEYNRTKPARTGEDQKTDAIVNLPVVVHVIHNNGPENISNAQVQTAIQHLNEAFLNSGYYDPADGVNTQIQFCLAKRDPAGNATNGINRVASQLTVMNGWQDYGVDLAVKNLSRWDPRCYINIWVVGDITGGVAGYAYLPSAHGSNVDGIVLEARYFGTSYANDIVVIHEMGHYLGLYHTFEGGCNNTDCATNGDRVCDTPPDQSTVGISCNTSVNSCATDALSGFSSDQNDLHQDYMDYGNWNCMKVFTQGQSDRMNWFIQNTRKSLLNCRSCEDPCPAPVTANFTSSANNVSIGTLVNFTNSSSNASGYRWYINDVLQTTATNFSFTFNTAGTFVIRLVALSGSVLCDSTVKLDTVRVSCPVNAAFSPLTTSENTNVTVNFTNSSAGATSYSWYVNGVLQGTGVDFSYAFTAAGNYAIKLRASNGACTDSIGGTVVITDTCVRQTFQKTYGGSGDDVAYDIRSTTDGGYIMAGKTNGSGAGAYDGYVVKMDMQGTVQWSRTYGGTRDDYMNKVLQTPDGGFILAGQTKSYANPAGDAWVVKIDGSGNVQWAKRYGENTTFGELATTICLTTDGGYAVCGSHNGAPATSNMMVLKLDANGNVQWSRIYDSGNTDGGGDIKEDNGVLMVTGFTRASLSFHDGIVMKIDMATGNTVWTQRYEVGGRNNFGGELFKVGNGYRFHIPSIQDFTFLNTGRNITLTLDVNGNATAVRELVPPDHGNGPIIIMADGSEVAVYNEQNAVSEFNIMKISSNNNVQWAKKYLRPGPQVNSVIRASQDGGFITIGASNPSTNNDIYVAKVDIQGNSASCDTARINVGVAIPSFSSGAFNWSVTRPATFTSPIDVNVQSATLNTPANVLCAGTTCVDTIPVDTCNGYTYLKLLGRNGITTAYDVQKTPDGGLLIAGETSGAGGQTDAIILRTDAKGNVVWSKTYGTPGADGIYSFIPTRDGNFVATGYGRFNTSHALDAFVMKFDINGNIIWLTGFGAGTASGERGYAAAETDDGGFVIALKYNWNPSTTQSMYARLDTNGNMIWTKLLAGNGTGEAASVVVQGDVFFGAGTSTRPTSTSFDGYIVKMRVSDGSLLWTRRIESQNRSNKPDRMRMKNGELYFPLMNFDVLLTNNFTSLAVKADTSGNIIYSRSFEMQGINRNEAYATIAPTSDGGFFATVSEYAPNTSPRMAKIAPNGSVTWANRYGNAFQSQVITRTLVDTSGYVSVGLATKAGGGNQNILVIRTAFSGALVQNSTGQNCPVASTTAVANNIVVQSLPLDASYWNISNGNIGLVTANFTVNNITLTVETPCIDTADCTITPPPVDTCNDLTYIKQYASPDSIDAFADAKVTQDNHLLVAGHKNLAISGSLLFKLGKDGSIVWQKKYEVLPFVQVINTSDNNHLLASSDFTLIKVNAAGNFIWKTKLTAAQPGYGFTRIIEANDGSFYAVGQRVSAPIIDYYVTKISSTGTVVWSKNYATPSNLVHLVPTDIVEDGTAIMVTGQYNVTTGAQDRWGFVTRINKADGSVSFANYYFINGTRVVFTQINRSGSDFVITGRHQDNPYFSHLFKINTAGSILKARAFMGHGVSFGDKMSISSTGEIISINKYYTGNPADPYMLSMYKLDTAWVPVWNKRYTQLAGNFEGRSVFQSGTNIYVSGYTWYGNVRSTATMVRFSQDGELINCPSDTFRVLHYDPSVVVTPFTHAGVTDLSLTANASLPTISAYDAEVVETSCHGTLTKCDTIEITGPHTVCNLIDTVRFTALRDSTCKVNVQWEIDNAFADIISSTDSTVDIRFKDTGRVYLYGTITTPCKVIRDSMLIWISDPPDTVNLGPDRELCAISVIVLNAGGGFASYRWQNGSTDSTLTIDEPGTYSVEAFDYCGNVFRDTVIISLAAPIPFDLGPDLVKCNNDTLTITAPAGFQNYNWADNYNINSRYTQSVKVWPTTDTTYSVIAQTALGCLVYDSIRVKVNVSPPLSIGADTSFCQNDSAIVTAPTGFTDYTWSTGETTQQIIVKNKGIYHLRATAPNGCISRDTLEVRNVFNLPAVDLGKDTIICREGSYTFDAGSFASYLWHDGSADRTFTATQVGDYWVEVSNDNGCVARDSAKILRIAALPQNFLDTAAEFCPYEKATLTAKGSFVKYRWSTGSVSPSIQTNIPGTYWLEVTNADGCTHREFINVKTKLCRTSIDFPNAFTPNNDKTNETYKPIVRGIVLQYKITIYNRWGQRVFETTDPTRAWDGTLGGKPQDSGAFVWICTYQFGGEELKTVKGTLLLIR